MTPLEKSIHNKLKHWQGPDWQRFSEVVELSIQAITRNDIWNLLECRPRSLWKHYEQLSVKAHTENKAAFWVLKVSHMPPVALVNEEIARILQSKITHSGYMTNRHKEHVYVFSLQEIMQEDPWEVLQAITRQQGEPMKQPAESPQPGIECMKV